MVLIEHFEQGTQKPVRAQHARRSDLDRSDSVLVSDGFDGLRCRFWLRNNQRARFARRARVAHAHGNTLVDCRLNSFWMQYFGPEIRELRSLLVGQHWNRAGVRNESGV